MTEFRQKRTQYHLKLRAKILQATRRFFVENDFLEVETPLRIPSPAPEAHIDAMASEDWFLQTSPELCMKRLLCAGYHRIFQICKSFRKNERGDKHLQEFTLLEWYTAGMTYLDMMDQCEELIRYVCRAIGRNEILDYQGERIDLKSPWTRLSVNEAFDKYASTSLTQALAQDHFDKTIALEIEPHLGIGKPLFLYDYPQSQRAFSRLKSQESDIAERFELYIQGMEICNAFSEIIDPNEQKKVFEEERKARKNSGKDIYPMPEKFLQALGDMPEASGNALGIDRLVMLIADTTIIDDVVAFTPEEL